VVVALPVFWHEPAVVRDVEDEGLRPAHERGCDLAARKGAEDCSGETKDRLRRSPGLHGRSFSRIQPVRDQRGLRVSSLRSECVDVLLQLPECVFDLEEWACG